MRPEFRGHGPERESPPCGVKDGLYVREMTRRTRGICTLCRHPYWGQGFCSGPQTCHRSLDNPNAERRCLNREERNRQEFTWLQEREAERWLEEKEAEAEATGEPAENVAGEAAASAVAAAAGTAAGAPRESPSPPSQGAATSGPHWEETFPAEYAAQPQQQQQHLQPHPQQPTTGAVPIAELLVGPVATALSEAPDRQIVDMDALVVIGELWRRTYDMW